MDNHDTPDEVPLEDADIDEEQMAERPLLVQLRREFLSVLFSTIGITFRQWVFIEDEIEYASWQRFWVTVLGAVLVNRLCFYGGSVLHHVVFGSLQIVEHMNIFDIGRDIYVALLIAAPLVFCAVYLSYRWAVQHDSQVNIVQHAQVIAIVVFFHSVISGLLTIVPSIKYSDYSSPPSPLSGYVQLSLPILQSGLIIWSVVTMVVLVVSVIVLIYTYFIMVRGMMLLHQELENRQVWNLVGLVFMVVEVPRILLAANLLDYSSRSGLWGLL